MGTLEPGWQVTPALEPWWQVIFYIFLYFFWEGVIFFEKKIKKTLFSLCFFSLSLFLSFSVYTVSCVLTLNRLSKIVLSLPIVVFPILGSMWHSTLNGSYRNLFPQKDTLRVRHRDTPSSDTPVVIGLGEGVHQKILIHQVFDWSVQVWVRYKSLFHPHVPYPCQSGNDLFEKVKFYLWKVFGKRRGLVQGLYQGSRAFPTLEPWYQTWHQTCFPIVGWVSVLEVIGVPSILSVIRKDVVLVRVLPTFTFRVSENVGRRKWNSPRSVSGSWTPETAQRSVSRWSCKNNSLMNSLCNLPDVPVIVGIKETALGGLFL